MALDHYVSQVHLKRWYSPSLGELMYATRKSDLKSYTPNSSSVCRIENGSTNDYLEDARVIEKVLKTIEPKYNRSVEKLATGKIDHECIYTISGFIAYILTCSPTAMRLNSSPLQTFIKETASIMEQSGKLPKAPKALGGKSLTALIEAGKISIDIDEKYPQSIGIQQIMSILKMFGNFKWEIIINEFDDNPFFTSDYPVALYESKNPLNTKRLFPLTPYLALKIHHDYSIDKEKISFSFSQFKYSIKKASRREIVKINRYIVQSAEDTVFYVNNFDWVKKFIAKNANYHTITDTKKISAPDGNYFWSTKKISKKA